MTVQGVFRAFATSLPQNMMINCALFVIMLCSSSLIMTNSNFIISNEQLGTLMDPWVLTALVITIAPPYILMIFFAPVNLVLSILYYCFQNDQTGMVKPHWAEKLG